MVNTIIVDFAGVVTKSAIFPRVAEVLGQKSGIGKGAFLQRLKSKEKWILLGELPMEEYWKNVCRGTDISYEEFIKEISWYEINDETLNLLKKLKRKYEVVLLTDNYDALYKKIIADKRLKNVFHHAFYSNKIHLVKMDEGEKVFQYVLKKIGAKAENCVFIDDKETNLEPARNLGIRGIQFKNLEQVKRELAILGIATN